MTKERKIQILMKDRCTRKEAEYFLQTGTIIFEADEMIKYFESYMNEWFPENEIEPKERAENIEQFRNMVYKNIPLKDWSIIEDNGEKFYIMYVL